MRKRPLRPAQQPEQSALCTQRPMGSEASHPSPLFLLFTSGLASTGYEGPESKYCQLCGPHGLCHSCSLCHCSTSTAAADTMYTHARLGSDRTACARGRWYWPMGCSLPSTDLSSSLDTRPSIHYQTSPGHLLCARLWARKGLGAESLVGEAEVHPHGHDVGQRVWW